MRELIKYGKTAQMAATAGIGDGPLVFTEFLLRLVRVLVLLSIWKTVFGQSGEASGMTLSAVLTYTLVAEAFAEPLSGRFGLHTAFWEGSIASRFLQPVSLFGQFAAESAGRWAPGLLLFSLPLLLLASLFGVNPLPEGWLAALLFPLSLILAITVGMAIEFLFGALMVIYTLPLWSVVQIRQAVGVLLSGALVPLALLPWGLGDVFAWLPFASMAWAPLAVYTGTGEPWRWLAIQAGWSIVLWPLVDRLWKTHRERLVFYGG